MRNENFEAFDAIAQRIKHTDGKWKAQAAQGDKVNTYKGLHKNLTSLYTFLSNERKDIVKSINAQSETYSKKVIDKQRVKLMGEYEKTAESIIEAAKKDIKELTRSKIELVGDMLATAPSDSQLRLLSVLGMRKDLDIVELQSIVPAFFDNYNAMKVLQNVASENGMQIKLPVQLDVRTMYENIERAHDFLMGATEQLTSDWGKMPTPYRAFYTVNAKEPNKVYDPRYEDYIAIFDSVPQLQEVRTDKTALTAIEAEKIKQYFAPVADVDTSDPVEDIKVLKHTQEVMTAHPEDLQLLKLSQYAKYVAEVEEAATKDGEND